MLHHVIQPEVMDDSDLDPQLHHQALKGLARLNDASRSARIVWRPIAQLARHTASHKSIRVLDIATGGGDIPIALDKLAHRAKIVLNIDATDRSETAIEYASRAAVHHNANVNFFTFDPLHDELPSVTCYDVVMCSLFLHHLDHGSAVRLLTKMSQWAQRLVIVSDLQRCTSGLILAYIAS